MSKWNIDKNHSSVEFKIKHLMISMVKGSIGSFDGSLTADDDTFKNASISFEAETASISTNSAQRDGHLKSPDFFDTEKFPKMMFASDKFEKKKENEYTVIGKLTMKGITKDVTLVAIFEGFTTGMDSKRVAVFSVTGVINRIDFGLTWNSPIDSGGLTLGNDVWLEASIELKEE